ncbi:MAG: prepilin-type N-terminal cleavage/methylation domain-containing protein [Elusimicrobia bacterium]|nr:prepilin-type N-terminal cleavage/methylation domain-containing protein [Elusimicrobiota bacterium]MDY5729671.1 prepilin-type N-terminal cleavage/methylation domain-containing protein [Elusimicrobiaceae bacterium]
MKNVIMGRLGGFTLIELLVVVLIIGILAAIAVPQYELAVEKARAAEALSVLKSIKQAGNLCVLQQGLPADIGGCYFDEIDLDLPGFECEPDDVTYCGSKNFGYRCDEGGCMYPYVETAEDSPYAYFIGFMSEAEGKKLMCYGDNAKGQRLCKALGGKQIEVQGDRIIYEL